MAHVDDGRLNALLDGELSPEAARDVDAHVATCAECARRLQEARAFLTEAGELLTMLTPPPRAAESAAPEAPPPRVAKTSKEIAVSVDGRTAMTPAIRPVFPHEVPPARSAGTWKLPRLETLAWAASLVLCLGVGYLANEVHHLRRLQTTAADGRRTDGQTVGRTEIAANEGAPAAPAERRAGEPDARQASGPSVRRPAERAPNAAPARPKPPVTKPAPAFAQPRPEQIAANAPAPAAAPRPVAAPTAGALGDVAGVAAVTAPSAARSAGGAGAPSQDRANALDEAAGRRAVPPAFQRVTLEDAVRRLSGSVRLIDGMNPSRVEVGPGRQVPGADPDREVIRVTYTNGLRRLVLDQQLGDTLQSASFNGLMPGDTLITALGSNGTQVRWVDRKFWLSLTGDMPADSVRVLLERIR